MTSESSPTGRRRLPEPASGASAVTGRFAPSPSGPLHRGSVVAALGSWLDARAASGRWLLRIEDIDPPRERAGAAALIAAQLQALGLAWDGPILHQSRRDAAYADALDRLAAAGLLYGCRCTRRDAVRWPRSPQSGEAIYPGSCRERALIDPRDWRDAAARRLAIRWRLPAIAVRFDDRRLGPQTQHPASDAGDPVLRRVDGLWGYQLAVVVDDADSTITDVVRGVDLLASTGRQILLQRALSLPQPRYLHLPLVLDTNGRKLSKHEGATAVGLDDPLAALGEAAAALALDASPPVTMAMSAGAEAGAVTTERRADGDGAREAWLAWAVGAWQRRYRRR